MIFFCCVSWFVKFLFLLLNKYVFIMGKFFFNILKNYVKVGVKVGENFEMFFLVFKVRMCVLSFRFFFMENVFSGNFVIK